MLKNGNFFECQPMCVAECGCHDGRNARIGRFMCESGVRRPIRVQGGDSTHFGHALLCSSNLLPQHLLFRAPRHRFSGHTHTHFLGFVQNLYVSETLVGRRLPLPDAPSSSLDRPCHRPASVNGTFTVLPMSVRSPPSDGVCIPRFSTHANDAFRRQAHTLPSIPSSPP